MGAAPATEPPAADDHAPSAPPPSGGDGAGGADAAATASGGNGAGAVGAGAAGARGAAIDGAAVVPWRAPLFWRFALRLARGLTACVCRLRVTGELPEELRGGPVILAANHIGSFDPIALAAACRKIRVTPRIMATGGLFRAPVVGSLMRHSGHVRVDRRLPTVTDAYGSAQVALAQRSVLLGYPEGRITLDPAMWPERGKTGLARLAIATGVPVVPVSQWGAHLVLPWGAPHGMWHRIGWAVLHRPVVSVHFGPPLLAGSDASARVVREVTDRIIDAITEGLVPLRPAEPRLPAWQDPQRPVSDARTHRPRTGRPVRV